MVRSKRSKTAASRVLAVLLICGMMFSTHAMSFMSRAEAVEGEAPELSQPSEAPQKNQGLLAQYYTNKGAGGNFAYDTLKSTTVDRQINFGNLEPVLQQKAGRQDDVSVRWTGEFMPEATGEYTFYLMGDNGFRLWIGDMNQPIIDFWENKWDLEQTSAPVHLEAGRKYPFKLEYFENIGGSNLFLKWSSGELEKQIVPEQVFFLPDDYNGPVSGTLAAEGNRAKLQFAQELGALPADLAGHLSVMAGGQSREITGVQAEPADASVLQLQLNAPVAPGEAVSVQYDGGGNLQTAGGAVLAGFDFSLDNLSQYVDYSPIAIAMSLYGSAKTNRSFAWYTNHEMPQNAPANAMDSIVEIVPAGQDFDSVEVKRFSGDSQKLDLKITGSTNGQFISHKVLAEGLKPGTAYRYRVGADGNWSEPGSFTTEADNEQEYEFLYMTDSQGANSQDYQVWSNTLGQALEDYPDSKFLVMTGDMVDAGALEYQWLDYFGKPQDHLMNLPLMTAVGNHEGPYNDNYYYHFNYPNDSIEDPLPPGSVYSYDYGDAHFMVINTMDMGWDDRQRNSFKQQIEWLRKEVAETDKKWKVVAFHKAIYSVGGHATDGDILELRQTLYPVFDELGIDVVLQGHDHTYMRSHQMYGDKAVTDFEKDSDGNPLNPDGTMYIVNNSAGTKYYDVKPEVNKYYADVFEQPRKPVYSGIRMTEDSFTIESYRSGEEQPFDTYTIVRNDGKPEPIQNLAAGRSGGGDIAISWTKPENNGMEDTVRGFRIYEADGKLGMNWSKYVPAEAGLESYQYLVEGTDPEQTYEFVVKAVDKRDNSAAATVSTAGNLPAAPTAPAVDDGFNTFGWMNVPGFTEPADYEYSVDSGETWKPAKDNPQPVGDADYAAGSVRVRVKADDASGMAAGLPLLSDKAFTVNSIHDTYSVAGELTRDKQLRVDVTVVRKADYKGDAVVVLQLLDGNTPVLINAIPITQSKLSLSQYFKVSGTNYRIKVFVFDTFDSKHKAPVQLARPIELK